MSVLFGMKRYVGLSYSKTAPIYQKANCSFGLYPDSQDRSYFVLMDKKGNTKSMYPEQAISHYLRFLVDKASKVVDMEITDCVITVPANFTSSQRHSILWAARDAGLNVLNLAPEPVAAAVGYQRFLPQSQRYVVVYDLGGGTFDTSLMEYSGDQFTVIDCMGDPFLGGEDFDIQMVNYLYTKITYFAGEIIKLNQRKIARLKQEAQGVKESFMANDIVTLDLSEYIPMTDNGDDEGEKDYEIEIHREEMNQLIAGYIEKTVSIVKQLLDRNGIHDYEAVRFLLVGGSSRLTLVPQMLKKYFKNAETCREVQPDMVVAQGAAMLALHYYCVNNHINNPMRIPVIQSHITSNILLQVETGNLIVALPSRWDNDRWRNVEDLRSLLSQYQGRKNVEVKVYEEVDGDNKQLGVFCLPSCVVNNMTIEIKMNIQSKLVLRYGMQDGQQEWSYVEMRSMNELNGNTQQVQITELTDAQKVNSDAQERLRYYLMVVEGSKKEVYYSDVKNTIESYLKYLSDIFSLELSSEGIAELQQTMEKVYDYCKGEMRLHF